MPAYSFKLQFVPKIERGDKLHTIRGERADGYVPKVGDRFVAYYAMRTKACRKLLESTITKVQAITITQTRMCPWVTIDGAILCEDELEQLAVADGFEDWSEMFQFWEGRLPFKGHIIHWAPVKKKAKRR